MIPSFSRFIPALIVMAAIFYLSHQPGDFFTPYLFDWADKIAHLLVYAMLGLALIYGFPQQLRRDRKVLIVSIVIVVSVLYGISDEIHQSFVPGRYPSISDIIADGAGALLVCLLWLKLSREPGRQSVQRSSSE